LSFWKKLTQFKHDDIDNGDLFEAIIEITGKQDVKEAKFITGLAGLMGRIAYADSQIKPEEADGIIKVLIDYEVLNQKDAKELVKVMQDNISELLNVQDYLYTRFINETATLEQKINLLKSMFEIAVKDDVICVAEEKVLHQTAEALIIPRDEFIKIKRKNSSHLETLKNN
jgi:uncharacterized tellurite resistance protein B-like protein